MKYFCAARRAVAVILAALCVSGGIAEAERITVTTEKLYVRSEAKQGSKSIGMVYEGDAFELLGSEGGWMRIEYRGKTGYVSGAYVAKSAESASGSGGEIAYGASSSGKTNARVNMREKAESGARIVTVLADGASVKIQGEANGYYRIQSGSKSGYVVKQYVDVGSGTETESAAWASAKTGYTTTRVNLRSGASGSASVVKVLDSDVAVSVSGVSGEWYQVRVGTRSGYLHRDYVRVSESTVEAPSSTGGHTAGVVPGTGDVGSGDTGSGDTGSDVAGMTEQSGYVSGASVNFRKGPGKTYEALRVLREGTQVTLTGQTDEWYRATYQGEEGFLSKKFVRLGTAETGSASNGSNTAKVLEADWWTSDIQSVFARGVVATITDVATGITWQERRTGGSSHADCVPVTAVDTAQMKSAYGGAWKWDRRAIWVTINGKTYAASMNGMPHGSTSEKDNNFPGHHCIHFTNSRTHSGDRLDAAHQAAVAKALSAGNA